MIIIFDVAIHISSRLRNTQGDEHGHGATHPAEVEEEAAGAEQAEEEVGGLHRHEDHQEVGGDGGSLHHGLQLGAEPLRCNTLINDSEMMTSSVNVR